jgi:signal transduction histidine kinase
LGRENVGGKVNAPPMDDEAAIIQEGLRLHTVMPLLIAAFLHNAALRHQLSTMKQLNQRILESMSSGVIVIGRDGEVLIINKAAQALVRQGGINPDTLKSLHDLEAMNPLPRLFREALSGEVTHPFEEIMLAAHLDGSPKLRLRASILPFQDERGEVLGAVGMLEDLSLLKVLEEERLRHEHLSALGEMAARLAHEIRNPLTGIRVELNLLDSQAADKERSESVSCILEQVNRLENFVRETLLFARPRQPHLELQNLVDVVERALALHRSRLREQGVELVTRWMGALPQVMVDSVQIEQAISNLITNALEAMPGGGRLTFSLRAAPPDQVDLLVSDTGAGIPPEHLAKIFEPFFSTKPYGTGLGLAIARQTLQNHDGDILVESDFGHGATFVVRLPLASTDGSEGLEDADV